MATSLVKGLYPKRELLVKQKAETFPLWGFHNAKLSKLSQFHYFYTENSKARVFI